MSSPRKLAMAAGAFFLISDIASIAGLVLYQPLLTHPGYLVGPGASTRVLLGALFEVILALANVGTAVTLFPVVRKYNEGVALGYVALRTLEAGIIAVGIVSLLAVVTLHQHPAGAAGSAALVTVGKALVAVHNWTFLIGPGLISGTNTVLLAYLMYRSRLVPRFIPVLGLVGGPLVFTSNTAVMFGLYPQISPWAALAAIPEFAWEISLGVWLIVKGFKPLPNAAENLPVAELDTALNGA